MRILLSAYACRPQDGSESGSGWGWATHLAARGLRVHVLTTISNRAAVEADEYARTMPNLSFSFIKSPVPASQEGRGLHYLAWQFVILGVARALHVEEPFDLVHHVTYGSIHVPTQLWRLGVPTFFGPIGGGQTAPPRMLSYFRGAWLKESLRTFQTRLLLLSPLHRMWFSRMTCVFATNLETLELARRLGAPRTCLSLDTGLPAEAFAERPRTFQEQERPVRLLWVGRMLPRKALALTLDGLAEANRVRTVATLTVLGSGLPQETVRQMLVERKLEDTVTWSGARVPWPEVQQAYRVHDAFLFTSLRESFGSQHLEAMANGLPVITLNLHGAKVFVPNNAGFKVKVTNKPETVRAIAEAIQAYAASSVQEKNEMSRAGWQAAKTFAWGNRADRAERLYKETLSSPSDHQGRRNGNRLAERPPVLEPI